MHARIGTFAVPPSIMPDVVALFRDRVVAMFSEHEGFLGYQGFVDREAGRFVGISFWTSRAALDASGETARRALGAAADLGAVIAGEPQIVELEFDSRFPVSSA